MTCKCHQCGTEFKVDLLIPDILWERIKPEGKSSGAGLLCGACIMSKIENICAYSAFKLGPMNINFRVKGEKE